MENRVDFTLVPSPDEPASPDLQLQQERMERLASARLSGLPSGWGRGGMEIRAGADPGSLAHLGSMLSLVAQKAGPPLAAALMTWVGTRAGRKVKIKVGDVEVEASNAKEIKKLLDQAQAFKQANEPKRIHER